MYKKVGSSLTSYYYTFLKSDSKTIKVKLLNSLGYAPAKGKIIKIKINGKTYTKKTNTNGIAKLKLPSLKSGVYTVKYKFSGNSLYKASSATNRVAIISTKNPTLTVKSTTTFGYGAGTPLKVAVMAGNVALEKRTVKFNINGTTYSKTTDKSGITSLPINLAIGDYTVSYSVNKDSKINAKSATTAIKVKQRTQTTLTWASGDSFKDGSRSIKVLLLAGICLFFSKLFFLSRSIKVLLLDNNSKAVSGQTVKLTVNSKTYSATTASNGYATFTVSLITGTSTVKISYGGSNDYLASSTGKLITVTLSKSVSGLNEANTISDLSKYLKSSSNCEVGNSKIKTLVNSLTSGLTTETQKATVIFNYVRDTLSYNFYYDTKYGAVGTLNAKKGNCVDHSHLLVAMFRTAGLAARYVHGSCKFTSGSTYGHVWVQVLIGNTWTVADATSSKNSLGKINNWNTNSFILKGKYSSLPF